MQPKEAKGFAGPIRLTHCSSISSLGGSGDFVSGYFKEL